MGLRINTNVPALTSLRLLQNSDRSMSQSLERLSTGLRINRASDDPSGLVISEQLRAQVSSLQQAVLNSQNAGNMINTAEAALNEVNSLLISLRESAIFSLNTGGASIEQINAEQDSVDQTLEAIDRIAATTRFATRQLINGDSAFDIRSKSSGISDLTPISMTFDQRTSNTDFSLVMTQNASQAVMSSVGPTGIVASGGSVTLRVTGNLGTEDVTIPAGASNSVFSNAINILRGNTGVYSSGGMLYSDSFGSDERIRIEQVAGTGTFTGAGGAITAIGEFTDDKGVDTAATLNGIPVRADGNSLNVVSSIFTGTINLSPLQALGAGGAAVEHTFSIRQSGLLFQLSNKAVPSDQAVVGIPSMYSNNLGRSEQTTSGVTKFGYLSSLTSGAANDLRNDPGNALEIIDVAIDQVSKVRAFLGAFVNDNIDPARRELEVHLENLSASESSIRDLDFAMETANLAKNQVLLQAGISVIAQANALPQSVLQLLQ